MVRDYKKPAKPPRKPRQKPTFNRQNTFFAGVLFGFSLSLLVFYFAPISAWISSNLLQDGTALQVAESPPVAVAEPKFEFYTILPEMEVPVREDRPEEGNNAVPADTTPVTAQGGYILQAGSFQSMADADQLKAALTLLGSEASIVPININGTVWHRVRIGPYTDLAKLNTIRSRLAENNIKVLLLRLRD